VIERNWLSSNIVVFDNGSSVSIVDTGYIKHAALTEALIDSVRGNNPVGEIINTHLHSDHCGGNAKLVLRHGCGLRVPAPSFERCVRWDRTALSFDATGQLCDRFSPTGSIEPGEVLHLGGLDWQVLAAPGHDPDSIVLFEPDHRILISADALWQDGFGVIFPELSGESGFAEQAAMLDLIERLGPVTVIPGHGPVFTDVAAALARARSRLDFQRNSPERHAQYAMKVLVRYLMLEFERASRSQLMGRLLPASIAASTAGILGLDTETAIDQAIDSLRMGGQLSQDESGLLVSH
jgi:glyoxylase-like metal-dependent hydrolase (beta-lactamase superfamily II)